MKYTYTWMGFCLGYITYVGESYSPDDTWWRHQMEAFPALLALCAGNSSVTGEYPAQRPVTRCFDVFFHLCLNKGLSKQSWGWWFETPSRSLWRHCNECTGLEVPAAGVICYIGDKPPPKPMVTQSTATHRPTFQKSSPVKPGAGSEFLTFANIITELASQNPQECYHSGNRRCMVTIKLQEELVHSRTPTNNVHLSHNIEG